MLMNKQHEKSIKVFKEEQYFDNKVMREKYEIIEFHLTKLLYLVLSLYY